MKKFISVIIALSILFLVIPYFPVLAAESPKISREQAVQAVKKIFDTSIYDKFSINYVETPENKLWLLNWNTTKEPYAYLSATVDADLGYIKSLSVYSGDVNEKGALLPKISENEAKKIAAEFAEKLQPDEFKETVLSPEPTPPVRPLIDIPARQYTFYFQRTYKGIPVTDNGFYITVDAFTGRVTNYSFNWHFGNLPSPEKTLSGQDAEKLFLEKSGLKLVYKSYYDYEKREPEIRLVYQVENPYSFFVDAITGEVIQQNSVIRYPLYAGSVDSAAKQALTELTPQEQRELQEAEKLLSKEEAIASVKKHLEIPENYELQYASIYQDYQNGKKLWSFNWQKKVRDREDYGSIGAEVDALTGELLSFSIYDSSRYTRDVKQNLTLESARKKADEFLKKVQPEKFGSVKLENQQLESGKVREYYFNYGRQVNDIPFPDNGFSVTVDAESGKILSFYTRWTEGSFPEPAGIVGKDEAEKHFLENVGLELSYDPFYESEKVNYRLVYKIAPSPSYTFDAYSMKPLDYIGNPIEEKPKTEFTDIEGHWAEKEIKLLCDLGVIEPEGEAFGPDEKIKATEFLKMVLKATGRYSTTVIDQPVLESDAADTQDDKIIETAIRAGFIKKGEVTKEGAISRELMAAVLVRALGYEKVASISDIYVIKAEDAAEVSPAYRGHAAISMGLGLIKGVSGKFQPKAEVTKAQAAVALVRFMETER